MASYRAMRGLVSAVSSRTGGEWMPDSKQPHDSKAQHVPALSQRYSPTSQPHDSPHEWRGASQLRAPKQQRGVPAPSAERHNAILRRLELESRKLAASKLRLADEAHAGLRASAPEKPRVTPTSAWLAMGPPLISAAAAVLLAFLLNALLGK
jgi:hypothetical protein